MKVLHTSDWHLGRTIYGRRCTSEFQQFLDWLVGEIERLEIDCLLVAGDVFDSTTPSNTSQRQYYSFLHNVSQTCCRHVVIIGGNHDSPSLLNAPRQLLQHLNVFIVGSYTGDLNDEVIVLRNLDNQPEAIICAVPFLRDRDVRQADNYESIEDKARKLIQGISDHYHEVVDIALCLRNDLEANIPIIAMGHLFTAGGRVAEDGELRDLYVGSLAHVHSTAFPDSIDYLALGHLHIAQEVNSCATKRYSGSPLQLSFGKEKPEKSVAILEFDDQPMITNVVVPPFLRLETIAGDHHEVLTGLDRLSTSSKNILLEIHYTGEDISAFRQELAEKLQDSPLELIRIINRRITNQVLTWSEHSESLGNLDEEAVFRRCLDAHDIDPEEREELEYYFARTLELLREETEDGPNQ